MDLNYSDHLLFKNYIISLLKNNQFIELLINKEICNNIIEKNNDINLSIHNLQLLLTYLQKNNLLLTNWTIKSNNNLFKNNNYFNIINLFKKYFNNINKNYSITYINYFNLTNENNDILIECFKNIPFHLQIPFCTYLSNIKKINNITLNFLNDYKQFLYIIINPNDTIQSYQELENIITFYPQIQLNLITNKQVLWTNKQIDNYLLLLNYIIDQEYIKKGKEFVNYIFSNNISQIYNPIILTYFDKKNNNNLNCPLGKSLTIDCNDLSFPSCCGLQNSIFNGGNFTIENDQISDIVAAEGINGYLNQKNTNSFFKPDCMSCENKYFCQKGCNGASFQYNAEPYIPIKSICQLENSKINFLIKKYHELNLFNIILNNNTIDDDIKLHLIQLLTYKGYNNYGFKYNL